MAGVNGVAGVDRKAGFSLQCTKQAWQVCRCVANVCLRGGGGTRLSVWVRCD